MVTKTKVYDIVRAQKHRELARYYNINSMMGNDWAMFYIILGGRKTGKSYSAADWITNRKKHLKDNVKNYWLRISETSVKAMLANSADKIIDPDLKRKYNLDLFTKGMTVYNCTKRSEDGKVREKEVFIECLPLSSFGKLKGVGFFDKDFKGEYNIILDEFQLEQGEMRTSFDILYNFIGMVENIARTTKQKIHVILLGNTLEEASTILKAFNFIPDKFGRFYLKSKRCVIDNLEPTEEYLKDREGSVADILGGGNMSNYTNTLKKDVRYITKERVVRPTATIKFTSNTNDWFVLWDGHIIKRWKKQNVARRLDVNMRPYMDGDFNAERRNNIIQMFDSESFQYDSLITYTYFKENLSKIRKSK